MKRTMLLVYITASTATAADDDGWKHTCAPFHTIYEDGKDLCESMFSGSFKYEANEANAYDMW